MWELDHKERWALNNWYFWTVLLEKTLESPLDWKEIQPVYPKANQSWIFIGRTDTKAEVPILWHLMWRTDSLEKTLFLGKLKMGEGDDRGWYGWMASPTQWTWVWVSSMSWQWTGKPVVLQSNGVTKRWTWLSNWTDTIWQMSWVRLTFTLANMSWTLLCHMLEIVCWMSSTGLLPLSSTHKQSRQ